MAVPGRSAAEKWSLSRRGPDYIDAAWLSLAAGQPCYNLDTFLMGRQQVLRSFFQKSTPGSLSLVEGNRGLYDGMDVEGSHSTAELAKLLRHRLSW